jgi:nucleoside-diphosphate-sugar epimerase
MKLAVTGCNGTVGKPVVALALKRGYEVIGVGLRPGHRPIINLQSTFIQADLKDYEIALKVLEGCDRVTHPAALIPSQDEVVEHHNGYKFLSR